MPVVQYTGLFHESLGDSAQAEECLRAAVTTPYAQQSGDYMAAVAAVHCMRRGIMREEA